MVGRCNTLMFDRCRCNGSIEARDRGVSIDLLGDQYAEELPARPAMRLCAMGQFPPAAAGVGQIDPAQQRIELHGGRIVGQRVRKRPLDANQVSRGEKSFIAALCGVFSEQVVSKHAPGWTIAAR